MEDEYSAESFHAHLMPMPSPTSGLPSIKSMPIGHSNAKRIVGRCVASPQHLGVGFTETFSPVVNPATVHTIGTLSPFANPSV